MGLQFPILLTCIFCIITTQGFLYHRDNEIRRSISLDGLWSFSLSEPSQGLLDGWHKKNFKFADNLQVQMMPVPASYNDISTDWNLREHVGPVWYQRQFFIPKSWADKKIWIRFSSVCYSAEVWINGQLAATHTVGHLPFQADVTAFVQLGSKNIITAEVDNTLSSTTIPQGSSYEIDSGRTKYSQNFDFFNYAGIDRPVILYTTPITHIDDVTVSTEIDGTTGIVNYQVSTDPPQSITAKVTLFDQSGAEVASSPNLEGSLSVPNANLWWPFLMDPNPGYLYTLQVELISSSGPVFDMYKLPIGIRTVTWDSSSLMINNRPVYLRGFGRHEDSDIRGKGFDLPLIIRDYNLIKWIGANAYRASHYPYADEILDLADQLGIMIIEESPAIGTDHYSDQLFQNHQKALTEMIQRDRNRPSVIMWVPSNAPVANDDSDNYYRNIINHIKSLDTSRPVSVINYDRSDSGQLFGDIACFNSYSAWFTDSGDLDTIVSSVLWNARQWREKYNKPVMITEYGADNYPGMHFLPTFIWSDEFQVELLSKHFEAFDQLREEGWFIGEMVWNFADFNTKQDYTKNGGNKKGIFTRNRQPKAGAHFMRKRYWGLAQKLDGVDPPTDLNPYVIN